MLTSIRQTHSEYFRQFHNLKIMVGDKSITLLSRYARKSSFDYVEEQENQIYPCVAIMDYTPVPSRDWFVDMKTYFGGKGFSELTGYLYRRPVRMEFRYDVSIVSKSYNEFLAMQDYFNSTFDSTYVNNQELQDVKIKARIVDHANTVTLANGITLGTWYNCTVKRSANNGGGPASWYVAHPGGQVWITAGNMSDVTAEVTMDDLSEMIIPKDTTYQVSNGFEFHKIDCRLSYYTDAG